MDIEGHYQKIIFDLEQGSRALIRFSAQEVEDLTRIFDKTVSGDDFATLEKVLCLVDHSAVDHSIWEGTILKALNLNLSPRLMIFALNCARKHIIQARI